MRLGRACPPKLCRRRRAAVHGVLAMEAWTRTWTCRCRTGVVCVHDRTCKVAKSPDRVLQCQQPAEASFFLPPSTRAWEESDDGAFSVPARLTESVPRCTTRRVSQPICWGTAERHWLIGRISASSSPLVPRIKVGEPGFWEEAIGACW